MNKYLLGAPLLLCGLSFEASAGQQFCYPITMYLWHCIEYTNNGGNLGAFGPPAPINNNQATSYSDIAKAAEDAAKATAAKDIANAKKQWCIENNFPKTSDNMCEQVKAACDSMKAGAPIDQQKCRDDVRYKGGILMNAQCGSTSATRTAGTFSWNYNFEGKFYSFSARIPSQTYDEFSWYSDQYACEKIVNDATSFIQSNCDTEAQYAVHEKCE